MSWQRRENLGIKGYDRPVEMASIGSICVCFTLDDILASEWEDSLFQNVALIGILRAYILELEGFERDHGMDIERVSSEYLEEFLIPLKLAERWPDFPWKDRAAAWRIILERIINRREVEAARPQENARKPIPQRVRRAVIERDGARCRYCGENTAEVLYSFETEDLNGQPTTAKCTRGLVIDHVLPVSKGGSNDIENLVVACTNCNTKKRARTPEQAGMTLLPLEVTV